MTKAWFPWDINYGGRRTVSRDQCARLSIKYIKVQVCISRSSSSLGGNRKGFKKAISLLESKHADLDAAGRGDYVHAMAMTKTTREADLDI
jgi:hypothetical protein